MTAPAPVGLGATGPFGVDPVGPSRPSRPSQAPVWLLGAAAAWSVGLIVAGLSVSPSLIQVNGGKVLVPLTMPLMVVLLISGLLWFRARRHVGGAGPLAWVLSALLDLLALAGLLTIGIFVLPVAALVAIACALTPPRHDPVLGARLEVHTRTTAPTGRA
jgi:hypothetical protein